MYLPGFVALNMSPLPTANNVLVVGAKDVGKRKLLQRLLGDTYHRSDDCGSPCLQGRYRHNICNKYYEAEISFYWLDGDFLSEVCGCAFVLKSR